MTRRTIASSGLPWLGWRNEQRTGIIDYFDKCKDDEQRLYFATLVLTGCRVSEAIELKPDQFRWNNEGIAAYNVSVLKHWDFVKDRDSNKIRTEEPWHKWVTQPRREYRNIFIKRKNIVDEFLMLQLLDCKSEYLLTPPRQVKHANRLHVYRVLRRIDSRLFPHFLRSQCVQMLLSEYKYDAYDLQNFFNWSSIEISTQYIKKTGEEFGAKMRVAKWPT